MIYDQDCSGSVTVDETIEMLYTRYGKNKLEEKMVKLFGPDMQTADGDGSLSFREYYAAISKETDETVEAEWMNKKDPTKQLKLNKGK